MIDHRGPEFFEIISAATERLKQIFMTRNGTYILTASGTGGLGGYNRQYPVTGRQGSLGQKQSG